jgi:hypothetical protein
VLPLPEQAPPPSCSGRRPPCAWPCFAAASLGRIPSTSLLGHHTSTLEILRMRAGYLLAGADELLPPPPCAQPPESLLTLPSLLEALFSPNRLAYRVQEIVRNSPVPVSPPEALPPASLGQSSRSPASLSLASGAELTAARTSGHAARCCCLGRARCWAACLSRARCCCLGRTRACTAPSWAELGEVGPSGFSFLDVLFVLFKNCANFENI